MDLGKSCFNTKKIFSKRRANGQLGRWAIKNLKNLNTMLLLMTLELKEIY